MPRHFFPSSVFSNPTILYDRLVLSHFFSNHFFNLQVFNVQNLEHLSYIGIFLGVAFSGYLIPIPEELVLLAGGFLIAQGILNPFLVVGLSVLGALTGDSIVYYLAGHGSRFTQKYHKDVEKTHAGWYLRHLKRRPFITIFFSRFIVGMRALNPLISGLVGIRWRIFATATFLSALIYIPIIIGLGWFFHAQIMTAIIFAQSIREILMALFVMGSAVLISLFITNLLEGKR
jgi:membrane protein DedA with SNARE-associated domain